MIALEPPRRLHRQLFRLAMQLPPPVIRTHRNPHLQNVAHRPIDIPTSGILVPMAQGALGVEGVPKRVHGIVLVSLYFVEDSEVVEDVGHCGDRGAEGGV